ncbi:DUF4340 domain-containing protein [Paenibacillus koleovorans]|uniref:DUF4340 domain-containing protein n=1 Tax=Paenibacillus koleovorans TaxID=121608 RepID=UPI000FDA1BCB|nr:DUF4340 domain-containing protein [Paenibacillus koleovorans]
MKRFLPTIILVVLCIAGFIYASSQNFFKEEEEQTAKALLAIKEEDVTSYRIKTAADEVELQRKDAGWTMTKPSAMPLAPFEADGWLNGFISVTQEGVVDASPADLGKFGLASPTEEYEVTLKNGSKTTLQIGSPLPIYGYYYAKLKETAPVYKLPETSVRILQKTPLDFIQKMPINIGYNDLTGATVTWNGASKSLAKSDPAKTASESAWKLDGKEVTGTDATDYLDQILLFSTEELLKAASSLKLDAPELKLELKVKKDGKDSTETYTGKVDGESVWIVKQGDAWAYSIPKMTVEDMFDALVPPAPAPAQ